MSSHLRKGFHSVTALYTYLVFVTKYRKKLFKASHFESMELSFKTVAKSMDFQLIEFNGESDHVHLLIEYPPKYSISKLVNHLKGVSSRMLRRDFPELALNDKIWSPSYFASSSGGAPIEVLKTYIQNQKSP